LIISKRLLAELFFFLNLRLLNGCNIEVHIKGHIVVSWVRMIVSQITLSIAAGVK
jgi:hypothetical protein